MKTKIFTFIIMLTVNVSMVNAAISWSVKDGVLTITGTGDMPNYTSGTNYLEEGGYEFYTSAPWFKSYSKKIQSVVIKEGVTSIGKNAFRYCTVTSITIPNSVTIIRDRAFPGNALKYITSNCLVPPLLDGNPITSNPVCYIPCGTLSAYTNSWGDYCEQFVEQSFSYEVSVKSNNDAFGIAKVSSRIDCENAILTAIPNEGCTFVKWSDGNTQATRYLEVTKDISLIAYFEKSIDPTWQILYTSTDGNIVTPYKTDVFGANIISNEYKDGQGIITFDGLVTSIGSSAFHGCSGLTSITIPEGVTSIGSSAFRYCNSLTTITIPEGVTSIEPQTFFQCSSLTSITIPEGVTSIGSTAFRLCSSLPSITIPESVMNIGSAAFSGCFSLTSITIPKGVTKIEQQAFLACSKLDTVYVEATTPPSLGNSSFTSSPVCIIPCGTKVAYEASDWARYIKEFIVEQFEIAVHSNNDAWGTVTIEVPTPSQGIGTFSVSATKQVTFSPGNLQYTQSTDTWSFAENQYDYIGTDNVIGGTVSSSSFGDSILGTALADKVDLFGLSTSTTNFGVSISIDSENDYSGSFIDWGTNKIGNDTPNTWRTLTYEEWNYLCWVRPNYSELCGVAQVNGVNGLIILPDNWVCPSGVTFKSGFHSNRGVDYYAAYQSFTAEQWAELESAGAVFLPAVGLRSGTRLKYVQCNGDYWSATEDDSSSAYYLYFYSDGAHKGDSARSSGRSVRLVKDLM